MAEPCPRRSFQRAISGLWVRIGVTSRCYVDRHFTQQRRSFGKSPTESLDEGMVPFGAFGARGGLGLLRQRRCRREPETNEERQGLYRDPDVALKPLRLPDQPIEPARQRRFLALGCVGRQERGNRCFGNKDRKS